MKKYNIQNYVRYKQDLKQAYDRLPQKFDYRDYTRDELKREKELLNKENEKL